MKLYEIIEINDNCPTSGILYELLVKYKKSLYIYYKDFFRSEPILMGCMVSNAVQYAKIVPSSELYEAICDYMAVPFVIENKEDDEYNEDVFCEYETICANSVFLSKIL